MGGRPPLTTYARTTRRANGRTQGQQPGRQGATLATAQTHRTKGPTHAGLLAVLEEQSYQATRRHELAWRLPPGTTQKWFPKRYAIDRDRSEHVGAAMTLATDLEACRALLRGDPVPHNRLDQRYLHLLERWPT